MTVFIMFVYLIRDDGLAESLQTLIKKESINMSVEGNIYVGKDTR